MAPKEDETTNIEEGTTEAPAGEPEEEKPTEKGEKIAPNTVVDKSKYYRTGFFLLVIVIVVPLVVTRNIKSRQCVVPSPEKLGDGTCDFQEYNTKNCEYDGGDCLEYNKYPGCGFTPFRYKSFGDGVCDNYFNTKACDFDKGDCIEFNNAQYPDCTVEEPKKLGDGTCDSPEYNTPECDFDGGDCIEFNAQYPDCTVFYPKWVGDGTCSVGISRLYNTTECGFDGGDCL